MYYDDSVLEEVRSANDIVDVVGQAVRLEKRGSSYFGLCPFHNEKTASFSVSPAKQMFYCFGCGTGGNVFSFVQKYDNCAFGEAVEKLADRAHITLPVKGDARKEQEKQDLRRRLLEANKEAATWFFYELRSERGRNGMRYLTERGLSKETMQRFGLGFAPLSKDALVSHLREKGFTDKEILTAGLAVHDEKSGLKDKFWNRVMFPIQDVNGRVIGFGGRVMGEGEPKYLNSPETLVFDKGRNLYALHVARNARKGRLVLCEGYMDVIAMHQAGITEAVASLGTAFTASQVTVLKRYVKEVVLAYDTDEAGIRAADRAIRLLRENDIRVKVLTLSPYKDPDELIKSSGKEEMERRILEAENAFFFEADVLGRSYDMQDPAEATLFYKELAKMLLHTFSEPLERENYLQAVCARFHVDAQHMKEEVARLSAGIGQGNAVYQKSYTGNRSARNAKENADQVLRKSQEMLLSWIAEYPDDYPLIRQYILPADFTDPFCRELAGRMYEALDAGTFQVASLPDRYESEEERAFCAQILQASSAAFDFEGADDPAREVALHDILLDVMKRSYEERVQHAAPDDQTGFDIVREKKKIEAFSRTRLSL